MERITSASSHPGPGGISPAVATSDEAGQLPRDLPGHSLTAAIDVVPAVDPLTTDLLSAMADVTLAVDAADRIVQATVRPSRVLGDAAGALLGRLLGNCISPGNSAEVLDTCAAARALPGIVQQLSSIRLQVSRGDIEVPTPRMSLWMKAAANGSLSIGGIYQPVESAATAAASGDDRFHRIYHSSPDAIVIIRESDHTLLDFNEGFTRLLGYTREDAIGHDESEITLWAAEPDRVGAYERLRRDGEINDYETCLIDRQGANCSVALSLRYIEFGEELCILAVARDITSRIEAETAARRSEAKFSQVFRESPDGIIILRQQDLTILDVNPAFRLGAGLEPQDLVGRSVDEFCDVVDVSLLRGALEKVSSHGWFRNVEMTFRHSSGKEIPTLVSGALIDLDGEAGVLCVSKNVAELRQAQEQLQQSEERFRGTFESAPIGILLVDLDGTIFQVNRFAEDLLGRDIDALAGTPLAELVPSEDRQALANEFAGLTNGSTRISRSEQRLSSGHEKEIWANMHIVLQRDTTGIPLYCIAQIADITEMRRSQQAMERLAFYDTLTDLANRRLFNERLVQTIAECKRDGQHAALMYLDLDQFKRVNDTLGHDSGDELLREVARRLGNCVRGVDTVARTGGDEFTILLRGLDTPTTATEVARRILEALRAPVHVAEHELVVTTSIGITLIPADGTDPNRLLKNADLAMYRAKESGRNIYQYFSEELNEHATRRLRTENELRHALARGEFVLHHQPKVVLSTGRALGFESLLRWQHPERGLLSPGEFISIAEETGVIIDLGRWVIQEACRAGSQMVAIAGRDLSIGVNMSPRQFRDPRLLQIIEQSLRDTGLPPECLELEITETMLMQDIETTFAMVERLAKLGVKIAIDDFGTGYSSLNYLKKFPISTVKVDQSFVRDIPDSKDDMAITAAVIAMAHKLNMHVVAEGVETAAQREFLLAHECDYAQGYLFSRAIPLAEACDFLRPRLKLVEAR